MCNDLSCKKTTGSLMSRYISEPALSDEPRKKKEMKTRDRQTSKKAASVTTDTLLKAACQAFSYVIVTIILLFSCKIWMHRQAEYSF